MNSRLYTNTGKVQSIVGLVVTTVLVSYASANSTKIVNDAKSMIERGLRSAKSKIKRQGKKQYMLCARDIDGNVYDTGLRVWK